MTYEIEKQGRYEIHGVSRGDRFLLLDGKPYRMVGDYFTISEGAQGDLVALSNEDFEELTNGQDRELERLRQGAYKLMRFTEESQFQNIPYLFLEWDGKFDELYLPDGLPARAGQKVHFIYTDHRIRSDLLETYLRQSEPRQERLEQAISASDEPPVEDYFDLTAGDLAERIRKMEAAELRQLEEYEERHKNRSTVLNTIRNQLRR